MGLRGPTMDSCSTDCSLSWISKFRSLKILEISSRGDLKTLSETVKELRSLETLKLSYVDTLEELPARIRDWWTQELADPGNLSLQVLQTLPETAKELRSLEEL